MGRVINRTDANICKQGKECDAQKRSQELEVQGFKTQRHQGIFKAESPLRYTCMIILLRTLYLKQMRVV